MKRDALTIWLSTLLALVFSVTIANAAPTHRDTHVWGVQGPGGFYGFVESQRIPAGTEGRVVIYETSVNVGPVEFALPCRASVAAVTVVIGVMLAVWLVHVAISYGRRRGNEGRREQEP
jgi:hypothetical protein